MQLPNSIDKNPNGKITLPAKMGDAGYFQNTNYQLQLTMLDGAVEIDYYGEDDTWLTEKEIKSIIKDFNK
jgi:hypothetical protein